MKSKIKRAWFYGSWLCKFSFLMLFYLIISLPLRFSKKYKDLWIIGERPDEARDNGYWLYKWILENRSDTNVRFVLARDSVDYDKMPRKDLIIEPGSAKHYICYILSKYSVSTHMHGACPGKSFVIPFLPFVRHKKTVSLRHGVTKDRLKLRGGLDAVVATSEKELEPLLALNPRYKDKTYVVGLCRHDHLVDMSSKEKNKIILVMPTFRKWLRDIGRLKNADVVFRNTDYFKKWDAFLKDNRINEVLEKNNLNLIFFPHKEMQQLARNFRSKNKRVKIGKPGEYDVQDLLKRSSLLVTDYSSVLFDFAYMGKPVIFYQFDRDDFFSKHYASSGKAYPFGDTLTNENDVTKELVRCVENNFEMKEKYKKDVDAFFAFRDRNNCERNYEMIKGLQ